MAFSYQDWLTDEVPAEAAAVPADEQVKLEEGQVFVSGMLGYWNVSPYFQVRVAGETDISLIPQPSILTSWASRDESQKGFLAYYRSEVDTKLANQVLGLKNLTQVWHWSLDLERDVIGWSGKEAPHLTLKRAQDVHDFRIQRFETNKWGAPLHLFGVPSWVQSFALAVGWLKEPVYDYGMLTTLREPGEALQKKLVDPVNGELVLARKALWAALGETDHTAWSNTGNGAIKSPKLAKALKCLFEYPKPKAGERGVIAKWGSCIVPHADAVNPNNGKPTWTAVCLGVFKDEAAALASEGKDAESVATNVGTNGFPPLPAVWVGQATNDGFVAQLSKFLKEHNVKKITAPTWIDENPDALDNVLGATPAEIAPWLAHVKWQ